MNRIKMQTIKGLRYCKTNYMLYLLLVPGLAFLSIYKFLPLFGIAIAFKDFNIFLGANPLEAIILSPNVGWYHFKQLFGSSDFTKVLANTLVINCYKILVLFPVPIICTIMLNEIRSIAYKKMVQTLIYIPYFFSWVVVYGIFYSLLGSYGMVNHMLNTLGFDSIPFFTSNVLFRGLLVLTEGWKEIGWNTVIYIAAISSIDPALYEAAKVDGANKVSQIIHITIPGLLSTIILMLIIKVGYILDTGFEQVLVMYNPSVYDTADIIQTYVYRIGLGQMNYSLSTALGLFNSVIAFILIIVSNMVSRKMIHRSIW